MVSEMFIDLNYYLLMREKFTKKIKFIALIYRREGYSKMYVFLFN